MKVPLSLREELAAFLRSRRARLRPDEIGLTETGRRRTSGLRREEVAQLAGIGVTWYTWLEQGRDVRPSAAVAAALAEALQLTPSERAYFLGLIRRDDDDVEAVAGSELQLLADCLNSPAYVRDGAGDLLSWNKAAKRYFGDFGPLVDGRPNILAYLFLNHDARRAFVDWEEVAFRSAAQYRRVNGTCCQGSRAWEVIARLKRDSSDFKAAWDRFQLEDFYVGIRRLCDSNGKIQQFAYATLSSPKGASAWISMYVPCSDKGRGSKRGHSALHLSRSSWNFTSR